MKLLLNAHSIQSRCLMACLALFTGLVVGCGKKADSQEAASQGSTTAATNAAAVPAAKSGGDFKAIEGKWVRSDAEYMLDLKVPDSSGKIQATYFNPRPINVSKAEAKVEDGVVKVFVELQDVGYPGCTYKLTYIKDRDALAGVYHQAAMQQSYDIMFMRLK
jgi:hypothetical protein